MTDQSGPIPGQVYRSAIGAIGTQYHILATYGDVVWALRIMEGVSAAGQPEEPENYNRTFFTRGRATLHRDVLASHAA